MLAKLRWILYVAAVLLAGYLTYLRLYPVPRPIVVSSGQPNIILTAIPKSGSKYLMTSFQENLGYQRLKANQLKLGLDQHSNTQAPSIAIPSSVIVKEHFRAPVNLTAKHRFNYPVFDLEAAKANSNKMVLHLRDPRQVLLSLIHHIGSSDKEMYGLISPDARSWFKQQSFSSKVDWAIDNLLPKIIYWIEDWLYFKQIEDSKPDGLRILITDYEELLNNEVALFEEIIKFYDITYNKTRYYPPAKNKSTHYRKGDPYEWQLVFNPQQKRKIAKMIPPGLLKRFNWDRPKIFQIGFNKCGTTTLSDFFNANGVLSIHYEKGYIANSIYKNYKNGKQLLNSDYNRYTGYFDMTNAHTDMPIDIGYELYQELDRQYPGSKFILNVRDKQAWLKSRCNHQTKYGMTFVELVAKKYKTSTAKVIARWSMEWDNHMREVQEYFKDRPNDLLVFNIERDPPEKLAEFFKDYYKLDPSLYAHKNKTPNRG